MSDRLGSWPRAAESSGLWRGNDALWWLHLVLHTTRLCSPVGFAVNLILILANPNARFVLQGAKSGMQENAFLNKLTKLEDLEPKANNCTKVRLTVPLCDIMPYRFITTAYLLLCVRSLCLIKPLPYGNRFQSTDDERLACCELCLVRQTELERSFQDTA